MRTSHNKGHPTFVIHGSEPKAERHQRHKCHAAGGRSLVKTGNGDGVFFRPTIVRWLIHIDTKHILQPVIL